MKQLKPWHIEFIAHLVANGGNKRQAFLSVKPESKQPDNSAYKLLNKAHIQEEYTKQLERVKSETVASLTVTTATQTQEAHDLMVLAKDENKLDTALRCSSEKSRLHNLFSHEVSSSDQYNLFLTKVLQIKPEQISKPVDVQLIENKKHA